jgi:hypothetical protein
MARSSLKRDSQQRRNLFGAVSLDNALQYFPLAVGELIGRMCAPTDAPSRCFLGGSLCQLSTISAPVYVRIRFGQSQIDEQATKPRKPSLQCSPVHTCPARIRYRPLQSRVRFGSLVAKEVCDLYALGICMREGSESFG